MYTNPFNFFVITSVMTPKDSLFSTRKEEFSARQTQIKFIDCTLGWTWKITMNLLCGSRPRNFWTPDFTSSRKLISISAYKNQYFVSLCLRLQTYFYLRHPHHTLNACLKRAFVFCCVFDSPSLWRHQSMGFMTGGKMPEHIKFRQIAYEMLTNHVTLAWCLFGDGSG